MKKIIFALTASLLLFMISCSHRTNPTDPFGPSTTQTAIITPVNTPVTYTNSGRLKSTGINTYIAFISMTVTASSVFYYDGTGKIQYANTSANGVSGGRTNYSYNSNGKLISIVTPAGSGADNNYYTYDSSNRLSKLIIVTDGATTTKVAQTFTYDANNRISRIDESDNGTAVSYRLITRDSSGYDVSETAYFPGTSNVLANIAFTRNDATKTISVAMTLLGETGDSIDATFTYDGTNFITSQGASLPSLGESYTSNNTLQSGPFDPAGMNGYYYTDMDLYGYFYISAY
jgi:YD repeat-containing protein